MNEELHTVPLVVNGQRYERRVPARLLASDFLRHDLGLHGVHVGCEHGVCGACTILLDGRAVRSCLLFAPQLMDAQVTTVEGLAPEGSLHPIQESFRDEHALQCGFCTPGFVLSVYDYLGRRPDAGDEGEIRRALAGNICRCTGYQSIVAAVRRAAGERAASTVEASGRPPLVGRSVARVEDPRLLAGRGCYVDDVELPGTLHAAVVRSPVAHALIRGLDAGAALALPGVRAVVTAADLDRRDVGELKVGTVAPGQRSLSSPLLARDRVRFVGEAVAFVVAEDRYLAEDACELVEVNYEELGVVVDPLAALEPEAPRLHDDWDDNAVVRIDVEGGDVARAFADAEVVVSARLVCQRHMAVPLETRGAVASLDRTAGELTLWISVQAPHRVRTHVAEILSWPEHRLRVIAPDVGGSFGLKDHAYAEEVLTCVAAIETGCPVKWIEDRREHFLSSCHAREQIHDVELAANDDGVILGLRNHVVENGGAYCGEVGPGPLATTLVSLPGPYRLQGYRGEGVWVATNKVPSGGYRGFGITQAAFVHERMLDVLAARLGLDPAEVRRRNLLSPDELPYHSTGGLRYDSGDYQGAFERALELAGYSEWRERQAAWRTQGRYLGIGLCSYVEMTGLMPSKGMAAAGIRFGGYESVVVRMDAQGRATVYVGLHSTGQGHQTTLAQLCAAQLGIPLEDVAVVQGDTASTPYAPAGSIGSRTAVVGGGAVLIASGRLREKLRAVGGHVLEADPADVELDDERVFVRGSRDRAVTVREVAAAALLGHDLPDGVRPGLEEHEVHDPLEQAFAYATHVVVLEVDVETGALRFHRYAVVHDCGTMINPAIVEGQIIGGIAQGVGEALLEELPYSEDGQPLATTFMDYLLPSATDVPSVVTDHLEVPAPNTPGGMKGAGEGGTIGAPAAIANAVADALAPLGVEVTATPLGPGQIWSLLNAAR